MTNAQTVTAVIVMIVVTAIGTRDHWHEPQVPEITDANFDTFVSEHPRFVLLCCIPYWTSGERLSEVLETMADEYEGRVKFGILNIRDESHTWQTYTNVERRILPSLAFHVNGEQTHSRVMEFTEDELRRDIELWLRGELPQFPTDEEVMAKHR